MNEHHSLEQKQLQPFSSNLLKAYYLLDAGQFNLALKQLVKTDLETLIADDDVYLEIFPNANNSLEIVTENECFEDFNSARLTNSSAISLAINKALKYFTEKIIDNNIVKKNKPYCKRGLLFFVNARIYEQVTKGDKKIDHSLFICWLELAISNFEKIYASSDDAYGLLIVSYIKLCNALLLNWNFQAFVKKAVELVKYLNCETSKNKLNDIYKNYNDIRVCKIIHIFSYIKCISEAKFQEKPERLDIYMDHQWNYLGKIKVCIKEMIAKCANNSYDQETLGLYMSVLELLKGVCFDLYTDLFNKDKYNYNRGSVIKDLMATVKDAALQDVESLFLDTPVIKEKILEYAENSSASYNDVLSELTNHQKYFGRQLKKIDAAIENIAGFNSNKVSSNPNKLSMNPSTKIHNEQAYTKNTELEELNTSCESYQCPVAARS